MKKKLFLIVISFLTMLAVCYLFALFYPSYLEKKWTKNDYTYTPKTRTEIEKSIYTIPFIVTKKILSFDAASDISLRYENYSMSDNEYMVYYTIFFFCPLGVVYDEYDIIQKIILVYE